MELRQEIRARRAALRLTQKALAKRCGLANGTICAFEAGRGKLSPDALERICAALGLRLTVEVVQEGAIREAV